MSASSSVPQLPNMQSFGEFSYGAQIASLEAQLTVVRNNMGMLIGQMQVCLDNQHRIQARVDALDRDIGILRNNATISGIVNSNDGTSIPSTVYRTPTGPNEPRLFWSNSTPGTIQTPITAYPTVLDDRNNQLLNSMNTLGLTQQQQQQNTGFQMTARQRDEAIMAMLSSNALPGETPTALAPTFPSSAPETMMLQNGMMSMTAVVPQRLPMNPSVQQFDPASGGQPIRSMTQMNLPSQGGGCGAPSNMVVPLQPVQSYIIDPSKATNEHLDHVCQENWIKELCLKGCKMINNFTPLSRLRTLWKLNLQGCTPYVDDHVIKLIATYNRRLSRINLCGCDRVTDATPLAQLVFLFDLNLSGCPVGNDSLKAISEGCNQLSRLAINSCPNITEISCLANLKELKLLYCRYSDNIDPVGISHMLSALGHSLLTVNLDGIKYKSLDIQSTTPSTIKNLNLKDNTEMVSLGWMLNDPDMFPAVETLDVEGCTNLRYISNAAKLQHLKTLRLGYTAVDDLALKELAAGASSLSVLFLEACPNITDFTPLMNHKSLTKISVDPTQFSARSTNGLDPLLNGRVEVTVPPGPRRGEGSTQLSGGSNGP